MVKYNKSRKIKSRPKNMSNNSVAPVSSMRYVISGTYSSSTPYIVLWDTLPAYNLGTVRISSATCTFAHDNPGLVRMQLCDYGGGDKIACRPQACSRIPKTITLKMPKSTDFGYGQLGKSALQLSTQSGSDPTDTVFSLIINYSIRMD
jgi:hypothetical protein